MIYEIDGKPAFRIDLNGNPVSTQWKDLIHSIYTGDGEDIDHIRTFFTFRSDDEKKKILLDAIDSINSFLKKEFVVLPDVIDWDNQEIYNILHNSFEKLSGTFDNPTKLMKIAPMHIKEKIRDLNLCVHHLEHGKSQNKITTFKIQWTKKRESFERRKLTTSDYDYIQFNQNKNEVYLAYNELGKNFIDLWKDSLPITYEGAKNNHYVGPDIMIALEDKENIFDPAFVEWCEKQNVDAYDKTHGIGLLPIGKIQNLDIHHLTKDSKANIILERNKK